MRYTELAGLAVMAFATSMVGSVAAPPNPRAGQHLATNCAACHGSDGMSVDTSIPNLAGQHYVYLVQQLTAFKNGGRVSPLMTELARPLTEQQIADISAYYASVPIQVAKPPGSKHQP
ncbi:c-type cytochrome [Rhizomicrobium electricum]|uniref:Cytochrome c domain-containing protein n=1 Tax=Rhizomicrobium electricum TaxID=480070 RepID=A0ABN1F5B7_9PROT|nr:cytochrome c [Rhizomicrobium electricum]NIJ49402.1 cytochrome c553 [Rhizomicrobium electricum]